MVELILPGRKRSFSKPGSRLLLCHVCHWALSRNMFSPISPRPRPHHSKKCAVSVDGVGGGVCEGRAKSPPQHGTRGGSLLKTVNRREGLRILSHHRQESVCSVTGSML